MMLISLAWKNIWRNKIRSLVVILAFTVGIAAGIFMTAFMAGMVNQRVQAITGLEVSHIQLHMPGFRDNNEIGLRIQDAAQRVHDIKSDPNVAGVSRRLILTGMLATADYATGIRMVAIDPVQEAGVTLVKTKITEGTYFDSDIRNPVVMSRRLADKLDVGIKNKVILTFQDTYGQITSGAFRIAGIFETDNAGFDESTIFLRYEEMSPLTGIPEEEAHEIAILMNDESLVDEKIMALSTQYPGVEILSWLKLSPEAASLISMMNQYMMIFMIIILLALCFGILNTMLMAVLERIREIGMLMAVGMSKKRVFIMIIYETIFLSMTGGFIGLIVGGFASWYTGLYGINLSLWAEAFSALGYSAIIYPATDTGTIISTTILMLITGLLSAIYPAYKALKYDPAQAIRTE